MDPTAIRQLQNTSALKIQSLWRGYHCRTLLYTAIGDFEDIFLQTEQNVTADVAKKKNGVYRTAILPRTTLLWRPDAECVCAPPLFLNDAEHWAYMREWKKIRGIDDDDESSLRSVEPNSGRTGALPLHSTVRDGKTISEVTSESGSNIVIEDDKQNENSKLPLLGRELLRTDELAVFALSNDLDYECVVEEGDGQQSMFVSSPARAAATTTTTATSHDHYEVGADEQEINVEVKPKPKLASTPISHVDVPSVDSVAGLANIGRGSKIDGDDSSLYLSSFKIRSPHPKSRSRAAKQMVIPRIVQSPAMAFDLKLKNKSQSKSGSRMRPEPSPLYAHHAAPVTPSSSLHSSSRTNATHHARAANTAGNYGFSSDYDSSYFLDTSSHTLPSVPLPQKRITPKSVDVGGYNRNTYHSHSHQPQSTSTMNYVDIASLRSELHELKQLVIDSKSGKGKTTKGLESNSGNVVNVPRVSALIPEKEIEQAGKGDGSNGKLTPLYDYEEEDSGELEDLSMDMDAGDKSKSKSKNKKKMSREEIEQELVWVKKALLARRAHVRSVKMKK